MNSYFLSVQLCFSPLQVYQCVLILVAQFTKPVIKISITGPEKPNQCFTGPGRNRRISNYCVSRSWNRVFWGIRRIEQQKSSFPAQSRPQLELSHQKTFYSSSFQKTLIYLKQQNYIFVFFIIVLYNQNGDDVLEIDICIL